MSSKRVGIELLTSDLKEMINMSAKIFPMTYADISAHLNPNGYEYAKVIEEGEHKNKIFMWDATLSQWGLIGADDVNIDWTEIKSKPSTFTPSAHTHGKVDITDFAHSHDDSYYTETEIDTKLGDKSNTNHTHSDLHTHSNKTIIDKLTQSGSEASIDVSNLEVKGHNHDGRYYTESEVDTKLSTKANTFTNRAVLDKIAESVSNASYDLNMLPDHETRLSNIENGYTEGHSHANLTALNKVTYTGALSTVDLKAIEDKADTNHTHSYLPLTGGNVSGVTTLERAIQQASGIPVSNLGTPSITETALFDTQFNNKLWFYNPSKLTFEYTNDGNTWLPLAVSDTVKKQFVSGRNNGIINIPNGCQQFRITIVNDGNYVYLNNLYMFWASQSHSTKVVIQKKRNDSADWIAHTASAASISAWPGHMYMPFNAIPWSQGSTAGHYNDVRIIFTPTWSSHATYGTYPMVLYGLEMWGGYPSGSRKIYTWDENKNVVFPAGLKVNNTNDVYHTGNFDPTTKSDSNHDHDGRYYTESEITGLLSGKSDSGHNHDSTYNNYVHPTSHPPSIITQDTDNRFVTDVEKTAWNGKAEANHTHDFGDEITVSATQPTTSMWYKVL